MEIQESTSSDKYAFSPSEGAMSSEEYVPSEEEMMGCDEENAISSSDYDDDDDDDDGSDEEYVPSEGEMDPDGEMGSDEEHHSENGGDGSLHGAEEDSERLSTNEEEEAEWSDEEPDIDLEYLARHDHPCLAKGSFSLFNSLEVAHVSCEGDVRYTIDMDGVVGISRRLAAFRVCDFGEARAYYGAQVLDGYTLLAKSIKFDPMPPHLHQFEKWLPTFRLMDCPGGHVKVLLRLGPNMLAQEGDEWQEAERELPKLWLKQVLMGAIRSLPETTRTRLYNTPRTTEETGILPRYIRLYEEDLEPLDSAMHASHASSDLRTLSWYYVSCKFGQRLTLKRGEVMGLQSFGLQAMFRTDQLDSVCLHLALNFSSNEEEEEYDLFWDRVRTRDWIRGSVESYPLFGLWEVGNVTVNYPRHRELQQDVGVGGSLLYVQAYTPLAKALEERVPLVGRPNLLTYMLGERYVSTSPKFKAVWDEVRTERTKHELLEVTHPDVPFEARLEFVVGGSDFSLVSTFDHCSIAERVIDDQLLVKVPCGQFGCYKNNLVKELYQPLRAAIRGTLQGPGTLGTVLLCETLLSYLPTGSTKEQPNRLLKAYDLVPMSTLRSTKRVDLRRFAELRAGVIYVGKPAFQKIWVPLYRALGSASARATAATMLKFLEQLRAGRTNDAVARASSVVVTQFKQDLIEIGVVRNCRIFTTIESDGCACDIMSAEEYVARVFVPEHLPPQMSTRSFLRIAMDLFDPLQVKAQITKVLLQQHTILLPRTTVHARSVVFSPSAFTLLTEGNLFSWMSRTDALRMVKVCTPMFADYFKFSAREVQAIVRRRPRLTRCVRNAVTCVRSKTRVTRQLLAVVCVVAVMLAEEEGLLRAKPKYKGIYDATSMWRFMHLRELRQIVRRADEGLLDTRDFRIVLDRVVDLRGHTSTTTSAAVL